VGERPDLATIDADRTDQLTFAQHRHCEKRASPRKLNGCHAPWLGVRPRIGRLRGDVGNVDRLLGLKQATMSISWVRTDRFSKVVRKCRRHVLHGLRAEYVAVITEENAEIGLAKARRVREHGLEHGLQLAWRTADDAEHFRGGRLLLQRL